MNMHVEEKHKASSIQHVGLDGVEVQRTFTQTGPYLLVSPPLLESKSALDHPSTLSDDPVKTKPPAEFSSILYQFITNVRDIETTTLSGLEEMISYYQSNHNAALQEYFHTEREIARKQEKQGFLEYLKTIAISLISAISVVVGGTLLFVNPITITSAIVGIGLMLSGTSAIVGAALMENEKTRDLGLAMTIAGSALGLAGGGFSYFTSQLTKDIAMRIVAAGVGVMVASMKIGEGFINRDLTILKSKKTEIEQVRERMRQSFDDLHEAISEESTNSLDVYERLHKACQHERRKHVLISQLAEIRG